MWRGVLFNRTILAVMFAGIWVNVSEFYRNEYLLKSIWVSHFKSLGMIFPSEPINGIIWLLWGFQFSAAMFFFSRKYNLVQTALVSWFMGFVLMWLVTINLNALPVSLLIYAIPLNLLETFIGSFICIKVSPKQLKT